MQLGQKVDHLRILSLVINSQHKSNGCKLSQSASPGCPYKLGKRICPFLSQSIQNFLRTQGGKLLWWNL